jgi:hypothetical protein
MPVPFHRTPDPRAAGEVVHINNLCVMLTENVYALKVITYS